MIVRGTVSFTSDRPIADSHLAYLGFKIGRGLPCHFRPRRDNGRALACLHHRPRHFQTLILSDRLLRNRAAEKSRSSAPALSPGSMSARRPHAATRRPTTWLTGRSGSTLRFRVPAQTDVAAVFPSDVGRPAAGVHLRFAGETVACSAWERLLPSVPGAPRRHRAPPAPSLQVGADRVVKPHGFRPEVCGR
jgi:hypothetical protein